jgi:hypothetical protein
MNDPIEIIIEKNWKKIELKSIINNENEFM